MLSITSIKTNKLPLINIEDEQANPLINTEDEVGTFSGLIQKHLLLDFNQMLMLIIR